jgi:hypothetical protein
MSKIYDSIDDALAGFIRKQHLFFVATAPLDPEGHLNLSPKGLDTFRILDPLTVAYLDLTGSGVETIAHLIENGRIVMMFCAFEGPPKVLRLYGRGEVVTVRDKRFPQLTKLFPEMAGTRAVIKVAINRIADSCGWAVPRYRYEAERDQLIEWAERKGPSGVAKYWSDTNRGNIDGLPGLTDLDEEGGREII